MYEKEIYDHDPSGWQNTITFFSKYGYISSPLAYFPKVLHSISLENYIERKLH